MKENEQHSQDTHLDAPAEANREKHINFPEVEEESSGNFAIDKTTSKRQEQWHREIKEGEEEKRSADPLKNDSEMPMNEDDTLGVP